MQAAAIPEDELGVFLRSRGLHADGARAVAAAGDGRSESGDVTKRHEFPPRWAGLEGGEESPRAGEGCLRRKEKARAEVTALLTLRKNLETFGGDAGDDTPTKNAT